jgi:hypothetical protein
VSANPAGVISTLGFTPATASDIAATNVNVVTAQGDANAARFLSQLERASVLPLHC